MKAYFGFAILLVCCATAKREKAISSVETLQAEMIGHRIDELKEIDFYFEGAILLVKDTTLEDQRESWKGLNYYYKGDLFCIAETSWNNLETITRISVKSHLVKTKHGLGVGENFESLRPHIIFESSKDFPDGYIAFKDSSDSRIIYIMNTEQHPQLWKEAWMIDKIPSSLQVQDVIIRQ